MQAIEQRDTYTMSEAAHESELSQIVNHVRDWPVEERMALASEILACASKPQLGKRTPLRNLVGLIKTHGPVPDDDDVRRILAQRSRNQNPIDRG